MRAGFLLVVLLLAGLPVKSVYAQTQWPPAEPNFPPVCTTLYAGDLQQPPLQNALKKCPPGQAVELAMGATDKDDSFLIDPITLPTGVSLIVDGGVTVYGTTDASQYQTAPPSDWPSAMPWKCGTVGTYPVTGPCLPLIGFSNNSGVYGYGVIDAQGDKPVTVDGVAGKSWWDLITRAKKNCTPDPKAPTPPDHAKPCQEASPPLISTAYDATKPGALVLYKITVRNPAYHINRLMGSYITIWDVKVQAPWNVPNTDGFDISGDHIFIKDSIVANGDQDIALGSAGDFTHDVEIDGFRAYAKGGIAFLTEGPGFKQVKIDDFAMTGDLPSVIIGPNAALSSVNGMTDGQMFADHGVHFYQAIPSATHDTQGMQIFAPLSTTKPPRKVKGVTFSKVCIADVVAPLNLTTEDDPGGDIGGGGGVEYAPLIGPIRFSDIHVLAPGPQFISPGTMPGTWVNRKYEATLTGNPGTPNTVTLDNFVFGEGQAAEALFDTLSVQQNNITALRNVYPALFNRLDHGSGTWAIAGNSYAARAPATSANLAYRCPADLFPFLTGELYVGLGVTPTGAAANLRTAKTVQSSAVTLFAVVQPVMSQKSYFVPDSYGNKPGLLEVGSPKLKGDVKFYDNGAYVGDGKLRANGTLAVLSIDNIGAGSHHFTAVYADPPGAAFYQPLAFGDASVTVSE